MGLKRTSFDKRRQRVRTSIRKRAGDRKRLSIHRSGRHIYVQLIDDFRAPRPQPPLHIEARLAAGFSAAELEHLSRPRQRRE